MVHTVQGLTAVWPRDSEKVADDNNATGWGLRSQADMQPPDNNATGWGLRYQADMQPPCKFPSWQGKTAQDFQRHLSHSYVGLMRTEPSFSNVS